MRMIQLVLLGLFALCSVLSFLLRVRMGMLEGAISRGDQPEERKADVDRYFRYACRCATASAVSLLLCVLAGFISGI